MRVARFKQSTSTPVANGSRVPQCPTLLRRNNLWTSLTTLKEVRSSGLSRIRTPLTAEGGAVEERQGIPALRLRRKVKHQLFPPGCLR